jgi:hypothetical protein
VEDEFDSPPHWELHDCNDAFQPITSECCVNADGTTVSKLRRVCNKVLQRERMFKIERKDRNGVRLWHSMGWSVEITLDGNVQNASSAEVLARRLDPLTANLSGKMRSDLHLHTTWSDGATSFAGMVNAAHQNSLSYIAVTDHSRSCKVQRGLTPAEWFRQSSAILLAKPAIPVLHGIEVDILHDGSLDLPHSLLSSADFVVGSVHSNWTDDVRLNTRRLISAIETGRIDVIGHPTSAVTGKPGVPDYGRPPALVDW